jgi:serine/threonine-protein kinase
VYVGRRLAALGFSRLVAIKRANPELVGDPEARRMLVREAAVSSRIHHAHVVAVHDLEVTDDDLLLVMEYVAGAALGKLIAAGGRLAPRLAGRVALDTARGLCAVHELCDEDGSPLSAVHRDVSPENVLVGFDGSVRITDFGLARLASTSYASHTGLLAGKLAYLAPEVLDGGSFTAKSDLFALGVVVWETLTGKRLFRGAGELATAKRVRELEAPGVSRQAADLPPELDAVVARALEKQANARFGSTRAFADALEAVLRAHDLIATDAELGAHVRAALGEDRRGTMARARVSTGAPAVDFTFAETASMLPGTGESFDDAPTALRLAEPATPTSSWRAVHPPASEAASATAAAAAPAPAPAPGPGPGPAEGMPVQVEAPAPALEAAALPSSDSLRASPLGVRVRDEEPPAQGGPSPRSWRRPAIAAAAIGVAAAIAVAASNPRGAPPAVPEPAEVAPARAPVAADEDSARDTASDAGNADHGGVEVRGSAPAQPGPERMEPRPSASPIAVTGARDERPVPPPAGSLDTEAAAPRSGAKPIAPAKERADDPTSLPSNPYRRRP